MMNILVTGAAGFIGFHTSKRLSRMGFNVFGIDNFTDYYDVDLKKARLNELLEVNTVDFDRYTILPEHNDKNKLISKEVNGVEARILQHEIDHLSGKLFVDYLSSLKRNIIIKKVQKHLKKKYDER